MTWYEYRVVRAGGDRNAVQLRGVVDLLASTLTFELPDGGRQTVDVVTARALHLLLAEAIYGALEPSGPYLRLERITSEGRPT
ncbi:MAG: hypothetical protein ACRDTM_13130 [Micromonosporaceae bacterium]